MLRLEFTTRARLWAEVVNSGGVRVFVPTNEALDLGAPVTIEVGSTELTEPLSLSGNVVALRPAIATFPAGVQVNLDAASVKRCEVAVGATKDSSMRVGCRTEPRVDCDLAARVLSPMIIEGCTAKNLSVHGIMLHTPLALEKDARLVVQLTLPGGDLAVAKAHVTWTREAHRLAGLRTAPDAPTAKKLADTVADLLTGATRALPGAATVLVADDDPAILDFVSLVVTKAGYRVLRADRGDFALALIRKERPQLVFLDVLMPGADGLEVCTAVHNDAGLSHIPIVLMSAMGEDRLASSATQAGARSFLTKPMRIDAIQQVLGKFLSSFTKPPP